ARRRPPSRRARRRVRRGEAQVLTRTPSPVAQLAWSPPIVGASHRSERISAHTLSVVTEAPPPLRIPEGDVLDPLVQAQCSLAVQLRRASGSIIGRGTELAAIGQEIKEASTRLAAVTLEGEPGIGKTRLLLAAAELTVNAGF